MSASHCSVTLNYFRSGLGILFTAFLETKTQLWKLMWAISGCCIGSSGSPLHRSLIFALSLNNWPIKFKFLSEQINAQAYVNLKIWVMVKSSELRQEHGWKSWFCGIVIYPFYENILIKRWKFWKNVISILLWNLKFLPKCLPIESSGIIFQWWKSPSNNHKHCILVILFLKAGLSPAKKAFYYLLQW